MDESEELTPVDDVHRVREEIDRICGGDIQKIIEYANRIARPLYDKLGLKLVQATQRNA